MPTPETQKTITHIVTLLKTLEPEERIEVFRDFCAYCGKMDPECPCWNDE